MLRRPLIKRRKSNPRTLRNIFNSQTLPNLQKQSDLLIDETWGSISRRMQMAEGSHKAVQATTRQVEAVRKAYDSGTITADLVLETLRKQFTARVQYAKYVSDLANDDSQPYTAAIANLVAAEQVRRDVKKFWNELADRGAPKARNRAGQAGSTSSIENLVTDIPAHCTKR